jgi:signal transduction histidine kinase
MWQKRADSSDFVWLARFRLLSIYTLFKSLLLLAAGVAGLRLSDLLSPSTRNLKPLLWLGIILGLCAAALLLVLGLVLASKRRPRSTGLVILVASDICLLLAVIYASILDSPILLLVVLVFISCTTPLLVERISRYAKRFLHSKGELASLKYERDILLLQFSQQLARAIEDERQSLKREIHDGLMQELSALLLQVSVMIMRNSEDGALQLNAADVARLETALRRAVVETRNLMSVLHAPELVLEK